MRIPSKRAWLTVAAMVVMLWWCHGRRDDASAPVATTTTRTDLSRFIARLPTPSQLKLHPFFIELGELRLEGQTIDDDKQPIGGAKVTLNGSRTTVSEADGSFSFDKLSAADYVITAEKDTFFGEDSITLTADSDPDEVMMKSGPALRLHVVDRNGNAIRDAKIDANRRTAVTDGDGNALVRGIDLGDIRLEISADGFGPDRIEVATGDDVHAVIAKTIVLQPGTAFGGTVVDEAGKPVAEASVTIDQGRWRDRLDTDAHGRWKVPFLAAGKVMLGATSKTHIAMPDQLVDHDGLHDQLDVVIHVKLGARVTGLVVDAQGHPSADTFVNVGDGYGRTEADGRFVLEGITPGLLEVSANTGLAGSVVRKVQVDRSIELRIELVDSSIAGVVRNARGEPVDDAIVEAKGLTNGGSGYAHSDEFGKFDLGGIPPGEYEVTAQRGKDRMATPEHGIVTRTTNRNVALVVSDLGAITGHVVLGGAPVEYFGITVDDSPDPLRRVGSPDPIRTADGAFVEKDLRPGAYRITIVGPGFKEKQIQHVIVADGATVNLGEVVVEPGRIVHGTVHDAHGRPIAGAAVTAGPSSSYLDDAMVGNQIEGTRGATSDERGNFEIAGLEADTAWIQATHENQMAGPVKITTSDAIDLVITGTGTIEGRIVNARSSSQSVFVSSTGDNGVVLRGEADAQGTFHFERVPPGEYTAWFGYSGTVMLPIVFHVEADTTTPLTIELPPAVVGVVVAFAGCENISLDTPDGQYVDIETCKSGAAEFPDITPGIYRVCARYDQCQLVTVQATPSHQALTIQPTVDPEPEPDPDDGAEPPAP